MDEIAKIPTDVSSALLKHPTHHSIPSKLNVGRTAIVVDDLKARILFKANKLDQLIIPEEIGIVKVLP